MFADVDAAFTVPYLLSKVGTRADKEADGVDLKTVAAALGLRRQETSPFVAAVKAAATAAANPAGAAGKPSRGRPGAATGPVPLWLEKAHEAFGRSMRTHVTAGGKWDVYTCSGVMQGFFQDVFKAELAAVDAVRYSN